MKYIQVGRVWVRSTVNRLLILSLFGLTREIVQNNSACTVFKYLTDQLTGSECEEC